MKRILLISLIIFSCENPLDLNYVKETYKEDLEKIEVYDRFAAKKIEFVFYYENPKIGLTYKEILDRYSEIEKEIFIKKNLLREDLDQLKQKLDSLNELISN